MGLKADIQAAIQAAGLQPWADVALQDELRHLVFENEVGQMPACRSAVLENAGNADQSGATAYLVNRRLEARPIALGTSFSFEAQANMTEPQVVIAVGTVVLISYYE
jgi:hypothetical protein